jgi:hypothetical protein
MELLSSLPWKLDFRGNPSAPVISPAPLEREGTIAFFPCSPPTFSIDGSVSVIPRGVSKEKRFLSSLLPIANP